MSYNPQIVKKEAMIDIESLGKSRDCAILSIGVIIFSRTHTPGTYIEEQEFFIDFKNQLNRVIDGDTLAWWMKPGMKLAREAVFKEEGRVRLGLGLKQLADLLKSHGVKDTWACSPDFDMGILQDAYNQHGQPFPTPFWDWRCVRTMEDFFYGHNTRKPGKENWLDGTAHSAIDDCRMQVNVIQNCYLAATKVAM